MLSIGKSVAALAALTVTLAVAAPAASAAPPALVIDPQVCQLFTVTMGPYGPTQVPGGAALGTVLANAGGLVGCKAPAPAAQPAAAPLSR
jgi:hypothetical protein